MRSQNIHFEASIRLQEVARISPSNIESMANSHVAAGDLLLNKLAASIGRVCTVPHSLGECIRPRHVRCISPKET